MKNRSIKLLLAVMLMVGGLYASAQNNGAKGVRDYASYPYWIEMMQDPNGNFFETQKAFNAYWEEREVTKGSGYKPFRRWEYYWQTRVNPDGSFPAPDRVYREYSNYIQTHPTAGGLKTGQAVWIELGPKRRTDAGVGRVNAIACHPSDTSIIYTGSPSGGLWKSTDSGKNWTVLSDHLPTLGVSEILIHPTRPDDILVGTGDRDHGDAAGLGVIRSTDGGVNWEIYNSGMGNQTVCMMVRSETDPDFILAATTGGIYKTTDGGAHWTQKSGSVFKDIKFKPGNSNVAYATTTTSGTFGFYRSEDAGETWTKVTSSILPNAGRMVIGVTAGANNLVYLVCDNGKYAGCFLSQDDGKTFVLQSSSPNIFGWARDGSDSGSQAWYDMSLIVDPINTQQLFVGGINLWRSDDGGKTWLYIMDRAGTTANVHVDQHTFFYNPVNKRLYAGNDGGIYYSDNKGLVWTEISAGLGIGQIYKLGVSNTDPVKTLSGFQDNGSATWTGTSWLNTTGGDGMECAVDPRDARYSYSTSQNGPLYRSVDNAFNRTLASKGNNGITEEGAWVTPFLVCETDPNIIVIGYKNIWITRNAKSTGTISWTKISNSLNGRNDVNFSVLENSPVDGNLLFAGRWDDNKFFRTENLLSSTVTWTDISSSLPVSGVPTDIECSPYDANTVYITLNNKVYKSVNKGGTWVNMSGSLPNISLNTLVYDRSSNEGLYVGTDAGIYYKDSDMADWVKYGTGLPGTVSVSELEIFHDSRRRTDSRLRASTFGRGVWEIPLANTSTILPPSLLTASIVDNSIELAWNPPFYESGVQGYRVYRNGTFLELVNGSSYTDSDVQPDITYTYKVTAQYNNGMESAPTNETFATILSEIVLPYLQLFENGSAGWSAKYTLEGWRWGTPETLSVTGRDGHFFAANSAAAGNGVTVKDYLVTPPIDLSSYSGKTITLKFAYTMRKYRTYDKFSAHYRVDPDSAWVKLTDLKPPSTTTWLWDTTQLDLPAKALTKTAQIGFYYDNSNQFAWGAAVDDVELFLNTTSAEPVENPLAVRIFPNPNQGSFNIELPSGLSGKVNIKMFNLQGQVVLEKIIEKNPGTQLEKIDVSTRAKGVYQLIIQSENTNWKQKITIQ